MTGPRVLAVPRPRAEGALRALHAAGMLDPSRSTRKVDGEVLLPVRESADLAAWATRLDARLLVDDAPAPRDPDRAPREEALRRLAALLPPHALALVPEGWEKIGDVLVMRIPEALEPYAREVARAFADALHVKTVLQDAGGVGGELREMQARFLLGDDPVGTIVEGGVKYRFDASRIMFSSGNVAERMRAATLSAKDEVVVDMFAGIGYFTLPLAKHAHPARVHALEKNPHSHRWLVENVALNDVGHVVEPWLGDNRDFPREGIADRVLMGYFPNTRMFLPKALALLKPRGGTIHYHDTADARTWREDMARLVGDAARSRGFHATIGHARVVKSYAPGVVHGVMDAQIRPL